MFKAVHVLILINFLSYEVFFFHLCLLLPLAPLQLADFEAALKQRDGIITQLTTNLQQAREEKDEIMKEFLELTEQSQKLQIQFQQVRKSKSRSHDWSENYFYQVPLSNFVCGTTS